MTQRRLRGGRALRTGGDAFFLAAIVALFCFSTALQFEALSKRLVPEFLAVALRDAVIGALLCMLAAWLFAAVAFLLGGARSAGDELDSPRVWAGRLGVWLVIALCYLPAFSQSSQFDLPRATLRAEGGRIEFVGTIGKPLPGALQGYFDDATNTRLVVSSSGGSSEDGYRLAAMVTARPDLTVEVDGLCASACVLLFAASTQRCLDEGDVIGLHRGSEAGDPWSDTDRENYIAALVAAGADRTWVESKVESPKMYYANAHELSKVGMLTCKI